MLNKLLIASIQLSCILTDPCSSVLVKIYSKANPRYIFFLNRIIICLIQFKKMQRNASVDFIFHVITITNMSQDRLIYWHNLEKPF